MAHRTANSLLVLVSWLKFPPSPLKRQRPLWLLRFASHVLNKKNQAGYNVDHNFLPIRGLGLQKIPCLYKLASTGCPSTKPSSRSNMNQSQAKQQSNNSIPSIVALGSPAALTLSRLSLSILALIPSPNNRRPNDIRQSCF